MPLKFYLRLCIVLLLLSPLSKLFSQKISAETMRQIQLLENEKASRTPTQRKINSQLLQALQALRGQRIAGVNLDPVRINADAANNLQVDISGTITDHLLATIKLLGGAIMYAAPEYKTVRAQVNLLKVEAIAALPEVTFIRPAILATTGGNTPVANKGKTTVTQKRAPLPIAERTRRVKNALKKYLQQQEEVQQTILHAGATVSEADRTHRADDAKNTYGYFGQGIKIGVLSDTYNYLGGAAADVGAGELPGAGNPEGNTTPVTVVQDYTISGSDEGRAMLQLIHDIAPKAQLFFATAYNSPAAFANNIKTLRSTYGCDIIIDDVSYGDEPPFQDGLIAQAVNTVTASGALYFASAGNAGSVTRGTGGVFESDFNDAGSLPFNPGGTAPKLGTVHNFGTIPAPVNGDVITTAGRASVLHWADPLGKSANDYDLFVVTSGGTVRYSSTDIQDGSQDPIEYTSAGVAGDRLVIFKTTNAAIRAFHLNTSRGRLTYATSGQIFTHAAALNAYAVAATPSAASSDGLFPGPFPGAFTSANQVEGFSSDGLRRMFFNPDSTAVTPGNFLFGTNGGLVRNKPDITAADGNSTTVPGFLPFYGTSAAAPNAGAIAALLKSARPSLTPAQIRTIFTTTALDIHGAGYDNVSGAGIIQAYQAMQAVNPTPLATLTTGTITFSEAAFSNGNGFADPGETADLILQLKNLTAVNATNAVVTLSTSTSGITITNGRMPYGNLAANSNATNTATPFHIGINSGVPCGTVIKFTFTISFEGGLSPRVFPFSVTTGAVYNISATLGSTPPSGTGYTVTSGQQTGRVNRNGTASTCTSAITNPGLNTTTGLRQYDAYRFTNTSGSSVCVTVKLTTFNAFNTYTVAYNNSGFIPSNPSTNYVAEPVSQAYPQVYSFTVAAGQAYTVVVHDVNVLPASNFPYTLSVVTNNCATGPFCTPIAPSPSAFLKVGAVGAPYTQVLRAFGGSGYYNYSLNGTLPAGLTFTDSTISGIPTQSGRFPVTFNITDATGCPSPLRNYTLFVAPSTIVATGGTPQTAGSGTVYSQLLQATVKDSTNTPLGGVSIIFTAPASGASGTFLSGSRMDTVITNASGVALADPFIANAVIGSYTVTASVPGIATPASFSLTNSCRSNYVVTSPADSGPGTLREALTVACANTTITFNTSISQIILTSGDLIINKGTIIRGPGADRLSISGNNISRVFNILAANSDVVSISGITIRDANGTSTNTYVAGGGMLVMDGTVNLSNCYFTNNTSLNTLYREGGAIDIEGGSVNVNRCTLAGNTAAGGGAINNFGGELTITNSTITGNTASPFYGGGIESYKSATITNSTIVDNKATKGGNIAQLNNTSSIFLGNTIVAGGSLIGGGTIGPDISTEGSINSANYNLVQNTSGVSFTGTTTNNITGVNPQLLPLGNYFDYPVPMCPLMPTSPAINAGNPALTSADLDQREKARRIGAGSDIGAIEMNYLISTFSGNNQSAGGLSPFANLLKAKLADISSNTGMPGDTVVFTAPASGASGTFPGGVLVAKVVTDANGIATAPTFNSNNNMGSYNVVASIGTAFTPVSFRMTNTSILPVVWGGVSATAANCTVQLQWKTLTEVNNSTFSIEYSTDNIRYNSLATLPAKGGGTTEQQYEYIHTNPAAGVGYYRIRQTDKDGHFSYSKILSVVNNCEKAVIAAYPNPVKDKLTVQLPQTVKGLVAIYDAAGRQMTRLRTSGGMQEVGTQAWAKGIYTLSIVQDGKTTYTLKLVKE